MPDDVIRAAQSRGVVLDAGPLAITCPVDSGAPKPTAVLRPGGVLAAPRSTTAGYELRITYARNDAPAGTTLLPIYGRVPTDAEMLPFPTPMNFTANAVYYFDLTVDGAAPVHFASGTTVDVWVPWVLDQNMRYDLTIGFAQPYIGPIFATLHDNVLHYELPGFTAIPGRTMMAEIDGEKSERL